MIVNLGIKKFMRDETLSLVIVGSCLIPVVVFIINPLSIYSASIAYENLLHPIDILEFGTRISGLFAVVLFFLFLPILLYFHFKSSQVRFIPYCWRACITFLMLCVINPIHDPTTIDMKGFTSELNGLNFSVNLIAASYIANIFKSYFKSIAILTVIALLVLQLVSSFSTYVQLQSEVEKSDNRWVFGNTNILVVSFDGISREVINKQLINQEFEQHFSGFSLFTEVVGNAIATNASLFVELYGNKNWKDVLKSDEDLRSYNKSSEALNKHSYIKNMQSFGQYSAYSQKPIILPTEFKSKDLPLEIYLELLTSSGCRFGYCKFGRERGFISDEIYKIIVESGYKLHSDVAKNQHDFLLQQIDTATYNAEKGFSFLTNHYTFTHYPIRNDKNCEFYDENLINQNYHAMIEQAKCVVSIIQIILKKLEALDVLKRTLVIFKSDHGKPEVYLENSSAGPWRINGHKYWGLDRYRPFLFIRDFRKSNKQPLKKVNDVVTLGDLAKTYCVFFKETTNTGMRCTDVAGIDLLNIKSTQLNDDNPFYIYVPESRRSSFKFRDSIPLKLNRTPNRLKTYFSPGN